MEKVLIALVMLLTPDTFAQKTFDLTDASRYFDIKVNVAECDDGYCTGKATFTFFKKGGTTPYQVINLPNTQMSWVRAVIR